MSNLVANEIEEVAGLLATTTFTREEGIDFEPVLEWVEGPDGKRRPTGPQETLNGVPLWSLAVRSLVFSFGRTSRQDDHLFLASVYQPTVAALASLGADDESVSLFEDVSGA